MRPLRKLNRWAATHQTEVWMLAACGMTIVCMKQGDKIEKLSKEVKYWRGYERTIHKAIKEGAKLTIREDILTGQAYIDILS